MGSSTRRNARPTVHPLYEPSTGTWQYVVADESTRRCVIINPTHEDDPESHPIPTSAPDSILSLIRHHDYTVDWLLETRPISSNRTAVYYLRMQLLERQECAPKVCGGSNITGLLRTFQRKYGSQNSLTTEFAPQFEDGEMIRVGNMQITAMQLDGPGKDHLGFVIGDYLFGMSWFTQLSGLENALKDSDYSALRLRHLWLSMAKILSFPPYYRIYLERSQGAVEDGEPFTTVHESRRCNQFAHMSDEEFINHWKAQLNSDQVQERPRSRKQWSSLQQKFASSRSGK